MKAVLRFLLYPLAMFNIWNIQAKTINFQKPTNDDRCFYIRIYKKEYMLYPITICKSQLYSLPNPVTLKSTLYYSDIKPETLSINNHNLTISVWYGQNSHPILYDEKLYKLKEGITIAITAPRPISCPEATKRFLDSEEGNFCVSITFP